ncbi:MAG TPA: AEC family transporter [Burkholderiaceae bacterium]|nr:AEC family transporter [Burkholderiaceae bacterium]
MFANALLMLPDFGTILLGALLARRFAFQREFWDGAERLVYYVLFPALLFNSILSAKFSLATDSLLLGAAVATLLSAAAMGFLARPLFKTEPALFASCVQTAYRYNSYVGLALAQSLFGARGVALLALILAVCIPLANLIAVTTLARHGKTHLGRELVTNPLILSTVSGMAAHLAGLELPAFLSSFLTRMGAASLALGLLAIGAGLAFTTVKDDPRSLSWFTFVKLVATPTVAVILSLAFGLRGLEAQVVVLFAALPTASSAYILAVRMGGLAAPVAVLITFQTLAAMVTLPLWLTFARF